MAYHSDISEKQIKIDVRNINNNFYTEITGQVSIPINKQYVTLCNLQSANEFSEINQLVRTGLIKKSQFIGIDNNKELINENKKLHPEATWIFGDYLEVIENLYLQNKFNPAYIYLDSTSLAEHSVIVNMIASTMFWSPQNTILFANMMCNNPRGKQKYCPKKTWDDICKNVPPGILHKWSPIIPNYEYSTTNKTKMATLILHKINDK